MKVKATCLDWMVEELLIKHKEVDCDVDKMFKQCRI